RQKARIVLDAYPGNTIPARVDQIAFDAKTVNNVTTYIVDVLPEETPSTMRSGMTANVTFLVNSKSDALVVPSDAIKVSNGRAVVMMADSRQRGGVEREVQTGLTDGKRIEVVSGLNEGDIVLSP